MFFCTIYTKGHIRINVQKCSPLSAVCTNRCYIQNGYYGQLSVHKGKERILNYV